MITIFHGDNLPDSRNKFLEFINNINDQDLLRLDAKNFDINKVNNFVNHGSLFPGKKLLAIENFFSLPKNTTDKLKKIISTSETDICIWQDKLLSQSQLKLFSGSHIYVFKVDNLIFVCLNSLKPHNLQTFANNFHKIVGKNLFDLFFWYLKNNLRRQLTSTSKFNQKILKKIYLQLIELEFQSKSGQLTSAKDIALLRVLTPLLK